MVVCGLASRFDLVYRPFLRIQIDAIMDDEAIRVSSFVSICSKLVNQCIQR